ALDVINKAFECLDLIGWEHAAAVLPTVVGQMVAARGADESTAWRQPVDLVALCEDAAGQLPDLFAAARGAHSASQTRATRADGASQTRATRAYGWSDHAALADEMLGDDPARIVDTITAAVRAGAAPADLGRSLAYAAALRGGRFGDAHAHADCGDAAPRLTPAPAGSNRIPGEPGPPAGAGRPPAGRGVRPGARALSPARSPNVPPPRTRGEDGEPLDDLPADADAIRAALLDALDGRRQVDLAARLVARHLTLDHSPQALIATLARARLREDAGVRAYQMLEAAGRPVTAWGDSDAGRHILIAVARYLAAHSPTERARRLRLPGRRARP